MAVTLDTVKLQFTDREDTNLYNILTDRLFKDNVKRDVLSIHVKRKQICKEFVDEMLRVNNQHLGSIKKLKIERNEK